MPMSGRNHLYSLPVNELHRQFRSITTPYWGRFTTRKKASLEKADKRP